MMFEEKQEKVQSSSEVEKDATEFVEQEGITMTREYHSVEEYADQLRDKGYKFVDPVAFILEKVGIEEGDDEVTVVRVTLKDIGLPEGCDAVEEIFNAAKERGLELCPAWVIPQYCLNSLDSFVEDDVHKHSAFFGMKMPEDEDCKQFLNESVSNSDHKTLSDKILSVGLYSSYPAKKGKVKTHAFNLEQKPLWGSWQPDRTWVFVRKESG